jgi:Ca-activated chloride channel family protein
MSALPQFASPLWLGALALVPALLWWRHRRGATGALRISRLPAGAGRAWRLQVPFYLRVAGFAALVLALARPQLGYAWEESQTEGIDIQLVLDISGSMGAEDFQPENRLAVAKQVLRDFIARRPADRLGLTVFGGTALTRAPLTTDRRMLDELVDSIQLNTVQDGTAIGVALANAASRVKDSQAKSKVIVLVTDGVNNAGEIDPRSAAAVCKGLGVRVYTIGVGKEGRVMVPVRVQDPETGRVFSEKVPMNVEVDEKLLQEIATRTGGAYFRATDAETLAGIFQKIDQLEKTPLQVKRYVRYQEAFQPFAWTAFALLLAPLATTFAGWTVEP